MSVTVYSCPSSYEKEVETPARHLVVSGCIGMMFSCLSSKFKALATDSAQIGVNQWLQFLAQAIPGFYHGFFVPL